MSAVIDVVSVAAGALIVLTVFYDLFQTVVLPRPAVRRVQLARWVVRPWWRVWRFFGRRFKRVDHSEAFLAAFGPLSLIGLFILWAVTAMVGYALMEYGMRDEFHPALVDFPDAIYVSATTLVPLSYGDFVPEQGWARLDIIGESATGVALAALAITLLFLLYESFRNREEAVVALDALAGAPPSAVLMLEATSKEHKRYLLKDTFEEWRKWSAMVLESHLAYPVLAYFRSSHDNEAWINSFSAVMDSTALVLSTLDDDSDAAAHLMFIVGIHMVEDLAWVFRLTTVSTPLLEQDEYRAAVERLRRAGYAIKPADGWPRFAELRTKYASALNQMASWLLTPPAQWVGDRSYLPHRERRGRRRKEPEPAAGSAGSRRAG